LRFWYPVTLAAAWEGGTLGRLRARIVASGVPLGAGVCAILELWGLVWAIRSIRDPDKSKIAGGGPAVPCPAP
jgi:hypothetical protein